MGNQNESVLGKFIHTDLVSRFKICSKDCKR